MPLDEFERAVDQVASPERFTRWIVRIVLLTVLIGVGIVVVKIAFHTLNKVENATTDRAWFVQQHEAIRAAKLEEEAAEAALDRHQADVAARSGTFSFSHSDDREATQTLNQQILDARKRWLSLVRDYNSRAGDVVDSAYLEGLPRHIDLEQESE